MEWFDHIFHLSESIRHRIKISPYLFALFAVVIGLIIRYLLQPVLQENSPLLIFVIAILITGWYGGFLPVLLATIISVFIGYIFFIMPFNQFGYKSYASLERAIIFILEGVIIGLITESRLRHEKEVEALLRKTTRQKRQTEKALRFRDEFVSIASHELKTPITTLNLIVQILQKNLELHVNGNSTERHLKRMKEQIYTITTLIDDLLNISKIQAGKLQMHEEPVNINALVENMVEIMQIANPQHEISIKGKMRNEVVCDKERISQVLTNLMTNAVKYSPETKKIIVKLEEQKKLAIISVKDFGIGIAKAYHKKIFSRFYRTAGSNEGTFAGFGLGLFIAKEIIRQHKGHIWVESSLGKGSTFYITLPIRKEPTSKTLSLSKRKSTYQHQ